MNDFIQTELFNLLIDNSTVTNKEMEDAYGNFLKEVKVLNQPEIDY
ncbi:hypothetical protein [Parabacteroides sp. Marseille-P3160]|nr:hypothetical protein [Parabacteroides sp. Marseille-P3160]